MAATLGVLFTWGNIQETPVGQADGGLAGDEACLVCHEERAEDHKDNPHANIPASLTGVTGCESCHGPGEAHVENPDDPDLILRFTKANAGDADNTCLQCHERGIHSQFKGSAHDGRDVSCTSCHSVHSSESGHSLLAAKTEFDLCTSCHMKKKAALMRSSHMPMREKSMTCSSCHNVHGGDGPSNLNALSVNDNCYSCHADKRAPMLWEHPPVKENCLNCHDPHGSLNDHLLVVKRPQLCQQCHDEMRHPTQPYGSQQDDYFFPGTRLSNRSCMNCHTQVHGSNHPAGVRFNR